VSLQSLAARQDDLATKGRAQPGERAAPLSGCPVLVLSDFRLAEHFQQERALELIRADRIKAALDRRRGEGGLAP
jgi:hypothetical protein